MKISVMNYKLNLWIGGLLLGCFFFGSSVAAESVAMVTDLKGQVAVVLTKGQRPVTILSELASGAEIILGKDCQLVVIYMKSGSEFQLAGPARILLGMAEPKLTSGGTLIHRSSPLTAESVKLETKGGKLIQGAIRMRDLGAENIKLQMPRAKIFQLNPVFQWKAIADDQKFTFMLRDEENNEMLVETQVREGKYLLQENIKLVPGNTYTWAVDFDRGRGNIESLSEVFTIASEEERTHFMRLKPKPDAPFSDRIIYAALLEQANFREDAQKLWGELSAERPELSELRNMADK